ncbi:maleylpyruvate isomerase family mycothiol-dependent enzyme [Myceligenerans indicum]|uniref:Maleylpyruvate isomerase family mycothiol-dependent enzyme n=1 Tax=Myceligenerans indicum TaxID=2593663 RepID=A0ABS1LLS1_9MICO|nr:maleylpyruvate isomerase family mycothiol-dependent enzyme [Myceligenerans indicum]MBL0886993.1 maleylpyruvate isomerase family mycothiol-dependent enzyme [Myceligenerans indicum]
MTTETPTGTALTEHARADSFAALDALIEAVRVLPEDAVGEPSGLPDWTRGHVLAHVDGVAQALARQAEYAARSERIAPYDGGVEGRNAAIEAGSTRTPAEHVAALAAARERLAAAWPEPGSPLWDAPTSYREGPVTGCLLAWWREVRIHGVDADLGIGFDTWDDELQEHLRDFLGVRLPEGVVLDDVAGGGAGTDRSAPGGETVVSGAPIDVAAWLAGREPARQVRATRDGAEVPLPELAPWPSARR